MNRVQNNNAPRDLREAQSNGRTTPEGVTFLPETKISRDPLLNDFITTCGAEVLARCGNCFSSTLTSLERPVGPYDRPGDRRAICPGILLLAGMEDPRHELPFVMTARACAESDTINTNGTVSSNPLIEQAIETAKAVRWIVGPDENRP